jgi:hypothetical protein
VNVKLEQNLGIRLLQPPLTLTRLSNPARKIRYPFVWMLDTTQAQFDNTTLQAITPWFSPSGRFFYFPSLHRHPDIAAFVKAGNTGRGFFDRSMFLANNLTVSIERVDLYKLNSSEDGARLPSPMHTGLIPYALGERPTGPRYLREDGFGAQQYYLQLAALPPPPPRQQPPQRHYRGAGGIAVPTVGPATTLPIGGPPGGATIMSRRQMRRQRALAHHAANMPSATSVYEGDEITRSQIYNCSSTTTSNNGDSDDDDNDNDNDGKESKSTKKKKGMIVPRDFFVGAKEIDPLLRFDGSSLYTVGNSLYSGEYHPLGTRVKQLIPSDRSITHILATSFDSQWILVRLNGQPPASFRPLPSTTSPPNEAAAIAAAATATAATVPQRRAGKRAAKKQSQTSITISSTSTPSTPSASSSSSTSSSWSSPSIWGECGPPITWPLHDPERPRFHLLHYPTHTVIPITTLVTPSLLHGPSEVSKATLSALYAAGTSMDPHLQRTTQAWYVPSSHRQPLQWIHPPPFPQMAHTTDTHQLFI